MSPSKRARGDSDNDGSDNEASNASEEAAFTDDSDDDDSAPEPELSDGPDDDEVDAGNKRKPSVAERLKRIKTAHPDDRDRTLEQTLDQVKDVERRIGAVADSTLAQPSTLLCTLHDYQLVGLRWLAAVHQCGLNGILADEMGLGKTAQSIALLAYLVESNTTTGPFLVIAPLSTLSGWAEQLKSFCPSMRVIQYTGNADERAAARKALTTAANDGSKRGTLLLASYEPVLADAPVLKACAKWSYAIIDEAHRLKNRQSSVYRCLLDELDLGHVPRLLLTGTPMQNRSDEFFSLLHFIAPQIYDDADGFVEWLEEGSGSGDGDGGSDVAKRLWRPLMLRRRKAEHLTLPPKTERSIRVPLTPLQRQWYRAVLEKNVGALTGGLSAGGSSNSNQSNSRALVNILASLRKCCNHPYLFDGAEPEPFIEGEHLVEASAKLVLLDRLLKRMKARGDRVLLFCQSTMMLDVLQDYLHLRRWVYERLDGSARAEERWAAVASFQRPNGGSSSSSSSHNTNEPFVFLLSTRAGGLGLNLTAANVVIFYDHDWNPQADMQATDRVHRLGQTRPVLVLRLVCRGTVEEVILRRAQAKLLNSKGVLNEGDEKDGGGGGGGGVSASMTSEAIRFGLADLLRDDTSSGAGASGSSSDGVTDTQLDALVSDANAPAADASGGGGGGNDGSGDSIYIFDGVDYFGASSSSAVASGASSNSRDDEQALQSLVASRQQKLAQQKVANGGSEDVAATGRGRRNGPAMSAEEAKAARSKQERDAALAEAAKAEKAEQRKRERWRKAGYTSLALQTPSTDDEHEEPLAAAADAAKPSKAQKAGGGAASRFDDSDDATDEDEDEKKGNSSSKAKEEEDAPAADEDEEEDAGGVPLRFAVGDAMSGGDGGDSKPRIVLVFTDDTGRWPTRGFFRSVSAVSDKPQAAYESAHENKDLSLGDAHLIQCDDAPATSTSSTSSTLSVCLLVVLKRDKRAQYGTPPELDTSALDTALARLGPAAAKLRASVHSPRLASTSNWYAVERLLRKHLRKAATTVYYFRRS